MNSVEINLPLKGGYTPVIGRGATPSKRGATEMLMCLIAYFYTGILPLPSDTLVCIIERHTKAKRFLSEGESMKN